MRGKKKKKIKNTLLLLTYVKYVLSLNTIKTYRRVDWIPNLQSVY